MQFFNYPFPHGEQISRCLHARSQSSYSSEEDELWLPQPFPFFRQSSHTGHSISTRFLGELHRKNTTFEFETTQYVNQRLLKDRSRGRMSTLRNRSRNGLIRTWQCGRCRRRTDRCHYAPMESPPFLIFQSMFRRPLLRLCESKLNLAVYHIR